MSDAAITCERCLKSQTLCVCDGVMPIDNGIEVLIIQHPQEQDVTLGTARLAAQHFRKAQVKVGLSWPSLGKLLGRPADPKQWAVLYLGSAKVGGPGKPEVIALDRKGVALGDQDKALTGVEGVIVLDGTWSQAKALWWRNAWFLKCRRIALNPREPSKYGRLRREARREAVSTLEAVALLMASLEKNPEIAPALRASFDRMLAKYRAANPT
jgi:DTW domain-containing protein YfiP